jgi:hypothetical protein
MRQLATSLLLLCALGNGLAAADLTATLAAEVDANAALSDKAKAFAKDKLLPLCTQAVWVAEVTAQNAKKIPLAEIQKLDTAWQKAEDELPIQKEKLSNPCAMAVKEVVKSLPALREVFVMDNQGANVGQNGLTSDLWQGDEDKWKMSFKGGKGGVDVGKIKFDKSANTNLQQLSLPILAADGTVIGAVCFGIAVDTL